MQDPKPLAGDVDEEADHDEEEAGGQIFCIFIQNVSMVFSYSGRWPYLLRSLTTDKSLMPLALDTLLWPLATDTPLWPLAIDTLLWLLATDTTL